MSQKSWYITVFLHAFLSLKWWNSLFKLTLLLKKMAYKIAWNGPFLDERDTGSCSFCYLRWSPRPFLDSYSAMNYSNWVSLLTSGALVWSSTKQSFICSSFLAICFCFPVEPKHCALYRRFPSQPCNRELSFVFMSSGQEATFEIVIWMLEVHARVGGAVCEI